VHAPTLAAPALGRVWQFRSFSPDTLDVLAANAFRETVPKGTMVIAEGNRRRRGSAARRSARPGRFVR
jgi:hypothetical protein